MNTTAFEPYAEIDAMLQQLNVPHASSRSQPQTMTRADSVAVLARCTPAELGTFGAWAGVSLACFLETLSAAKNKNEELGRKPLGAQISISQSATTYLPVEFHGITHEAYQSLEPFAITYGWALSPFGYCFIAIAPQGICQCVFFDQQEAHVELIEALRAEWPLSHIVENQSSAAASIQRMFNTVTDKAPQPIFAKGTAFQLAVWQALLSVPAGQCRAYGDIAKQLGNASAVRAVSSAIARNAIAYLIPCHRVVRSNGAINQYRWGARRKQAMLLREWLVATFDNRVAG